MKGSAVFERYLLPERFRRITFTPRPATKMIVAPRFEITAESAYLRCVFRNPNSYEIGAEFLSARIRWGAVRARAGHAQSEAIVCRSRCRSRRQRNQPSRMI